jgi:hypothetical protein
MYSDEGWCAKEPLDETKDISILFKKNDFLFRKINQ